MSKLKNIGKGIGAIYGYFLDFALGGKRDIERTIKSGMPHSAIIIEGTLD